MDDAFRPDETETQWLVNPERYRSLRRVFFCVGAQKTGTTWLYTMLSRNPDCHLPPIKELHYWDWQIGRIERNCVSRNEVRLNRALAHRRRALLHPWQLPAAISRVRAFTKAREMWAGAGTPTGEAIYADLLMHGYRGQPVAGEITPSYAMLPSADLARMARIFPDTRFIFIMRDPVARLWSGIKHRYRAELAAGEDVGPILKASFCRALADPGDAAYRRGDYAATIAALDAAVPADRILYLFYETMFSDAVWRKIAAFLEIKAAPADFSVRPNRSQDESHCLTEADAAAARDALAPIYDAVAARFGAEMPATWRTAGGR